MSTKRNRQEKVISRSVISIQKDPDRAYASGLITDYSHFAVRRLHRTPTSWLLDSGSWLLPFVSFVPFPYCRIPFESPRLERKFRKAHCPAFLH